MTCKNPFSPLRKVRGSQVTQPDYSMHAIVTGAGGFLGRYVARALSNSGWRVTGIGHGHFAHQEQAEWGIASWYSSDISVNAMTEVMRHEGEPQLNFHSAGSASVGRSWDAPLQDFERTVVTLAAVIESLRRHAPMALLIYPSSAAVYGNSHAMPSRRQRPHAYVALRGEQTRG